MKTDRIVHFKYVQVSILQLYFNKGGKNLQEIKGILFELSKKMCLFLGGGEGVQGGEEVDREQRSPRSCVWS